MRGSARGKSRIGLRIGSRITSRITSFTIAGCRNFTVAAAMHVRINLFPPGLNPGNAPR
jgi:hypothetical protein